MIVAYIIAVHGYSHCGNKVHVKYVKTLKNVKFIHSSDTSLKGEGSDFELKRG